MIVKVALTALLALVSVPATPEASEPVPVDQIARAKFPKEDGEFVDALAALNAFVNNAITYTDDTSHYGVTDLWVQIPTDGKGDCEDYALSKLFMLEEAGFPVITSSKIVMVIVNDGGKKYGHAILAVRMPNGSVAYLDLRPEPMTRAELVAKGYEFFDWTA